jgi:hypothetical protein
MKWPSIYRYKGSWWHGGFSQHGNFGGWRNMLSEFVWLVRHGRWYFGWNWPELVFGIGRDWYDGPIWFLNAGVFSVNLASD